MRPVPFEGNENRAAQGREKGEVGEEADRPELGRDGERRRVRDVLALPPAGVGFAPAHERLRADADPDDGVGGVDRPGHLHERQPVARDLARRVAVALGQDEDARDKRQRGG